VGPGLPDWTAPLAERARIRLRAKRFSAAERRDGLCVVASPDGRKGSLRIHQDALVYSAMLDPGQHVVHELSPGRKAWLHVVQGEITLGDLVLTTVMALVSRTSERSRSQRRPRRDSASRCWCGTAGASRNGHLT